MYLWNTDVSPSVTRRSPCLVVHVVQGQPIGCTEAYGTQSNSRVELVELIGQAGQGCADRGVLEGGVDGDHLVDRLAAFLQQVQGNRRQLRLGAKGGDQHRGGGS